MFALFLSCRVLANIGLKYVCPKMVFLSVFESAVGTRVRNSVGIQQNDSSDLLSLIGLPSMARLGLTEIIGSSIRSSNLFFRSSLK